MGKTDVSNQEEEEREHYSVNRFFSDRALALIDRYHLSTDLFEKGKRHDEKEVMEYIKTHEIPLPKPLMPMQKALIANVEAAAKKPVYHIFDAIDTVLLRQYESEELTMTVWLIKLFGEAMMRHEEVRTTLGPYGLQIWPNASISVAMAHGKALYAVVFKDVNRKSVEEIAETLAEYKKKIAEGRVLLEAMEHSSFGISNLGMTGIERFDALIHKDDSGIAAIGSERNGRLGVTLTMDHRLVNGYQAARFMQTLKELAVDIGFFGGDG